MASVPRVETRIRLAEAAVAAAVAVLNEELRNLRPLSKRPRCCPTPELRHVQRGVAQICKVTAGSQSESGAAAAYTDGWDDMTESGDVTAYILCETCSKRSGVPADIDWD